MLVFGFGITTDVEHIRYAALDRDQSAESRTYLEQFNGSPLYFTRSRPLFSDVEALARVPAGRQPKATIRIVLDWDAMIAKR
jgi:ribosome-dependent ATPase